MKVKELIEQLAHYSPEEELLVEYWDKECVEGYGTSRKMTDEEWSDVVSYVENGEWHYQSSASSTITEMAEKVIADAEEGW
jgi:hypothetical protein